MEIEIPQSLEDFTAQQLFDLTEDAQDHDRVLRRLQVQWLDDELMAIEKLMDEAASEDEISAGLIRDWMKARKLRSDLVKNDPALMSNSGIMTGYDIAREIDNVQPNAPVCPCCYRDDAVATVRGIGGVLMCADCAREASCRDPESGSVLPTA